MKVTRRIGTGWGRRWAFLLLSSIACAASAALPEGYKLLEYIQGDGTSRLLTGWTVRPQEDVVEATIEITDWASSATVWCTRGEANSDSSFTLFYMGGGVLRFDNSSRTSGLTPDYMPLDAGVAYTVTASNALFSVSNGARVEHVVDPNFTNTVAELMLFASYNGRVDNKVTNYSRNRLRSLRIWRQGELRRDWVPVRTAAGVVTLRDVVNGVDLAPISVGSFVAGPVVSPKLDFAVPNQLLGPSPVEPFFTVTNAVTGEELAYGSDYTVAFESNAREGVGRATVTTTASSPCPGERKMVEFPIRAAVPKGYTRLEYVQGDGKSYWNTTYRPNPQTDRVEVEYSFTDRRTTGLFCARDNNAGQSWSFCYILGSSGLQYRLDYQGASAVLFTTNPDILMNERYVLSVSNSTVRVSNGVMKSAAVASSFEKAGNDMTIFAYYSGGQDKGMASWSTQRLYSFRVWRRDGLIHDWVPVRTTNDVVTLYDTVTGEDLTPKGTGTFIAGPDFATTDSIHISDIPQQTMGENDASCTPDPEISVVASGCRLVRDTDYTVAYVNNTEPGAATATITGIGEWEGKFATTRSFVIIGTLPSSYTRLEYIQGAGGRFVTDYTVSFQTDRIDTEIAITQTNTAEAIWCARGYLQTTGSCTLFHLANNLFRSDFGSSTDPQFGQLIGFLPNVKYAVSYEKGATVIGERAHLVRPAQPALTQAGGPLVFFASYYGADTYSNVQYPSTHRLYSFTVSSNGIPQRIWLPVRSPQGVVTLYDIMKRQELQPIGPAFIAGPEYADFDLYVKDQVWDGERKVRPPVVATNRTTGVELVQGRDYDVTLARNDVEGIATLTATGRAGSDYEGQGAQVDFKIRKALPDGYERLEWLRSDGRTYFQTDYVPQVRTDALTIEYELMDKSQSGLFCSRAESVSNAWSFCFFANSKEYRFDYERLSMPFTHWASVSEIGHRCTLRAADASVQLSNGVSSNRTSIVSFTQGGGPLALLAYYNNSTSLSPSSITTAKLFGCVIEREGEPIHDWVPVRTPNGVVTLHDRVTGDDLEPKGTGAFIAGPAWVCEGPFIPPHATILIVR